MQVLRRPGHNVRWIPRGAAIVVALFASALLGGCLGSSSDDAGDRYFETMRKVSQQYRLPGVVAGVWVPGQDAWRIADGMADVAGNRQMSLDDRFAIRSITKAVTVTVILQLVREQVLSLEDPIGKYVQGIPNGNEITLADLAGMQSGVKNYTNVDAFIEVFAADFARPWTPEEIVAYAIPESPVFDPGEQYDYSNTNTLLLGMVVEKVTGRPLVDAFQTRIFAPLGLRATSYPQDASLPSPHPVPYEVDRAGGPPEVLPLVNLSSLGAAGGLVMNLEDLRTWGEALGDGRLVGAELQMERMDRSRPATNGPKYDLYGLGMGVLDGWWGHSGEALGFQAAVFRNPKSGAVIAVLLNSTQPVNVAIEMFQALAAEVDGR